MIIEDRKRPSLIRHLIFWVIVAMVFSIIMYVKLKPVIDYQYKNDDLFTNLDAEIMLKERLENGTYTNVGSEWNVKKDNAQIRYTSIPAE